MKNLVLLVCCFLMLQICAIAQSQDNMAGSLGLPGDNLNLYAVMKLFQESKTLELFEKNLNDENSRINNLDLNGDGQIDYISVVDNFDGKVHTIVLKDAISANENQDVAVFYVGKDANNRIQIQLIGDEALYGKDYIIEPNIGGNVNAGQTVNPGYSGNRDVVVEQPVIMESSAWPLLGFLFLPSYVVWHSPYYYGYYPNYWRPWHPVFWHSYYGYHSNLNHYYEGNYRRTVVYHDNRFREHYYATRHVAPTVIQHRNAGFYKNTYSHPELRREGIIQYNRSHPANLSHPENRAGIQQQRGAFPASRQIGNRPVNTQGINRPVSRPGTFNSGPAVNQNKSIPATRQAVSQPRPSVNQSIERTQTARPVTPSGNQNNARTFARPATNTPQNRPANIRVSAQPSNNQGQIHQSPAVSRQPAPKAAAAARPTKVPPKKENTK